MMKITKRIAKRVSAMFLIFVMVLSMAACGEKKKDVADNNEETAEYTYVAKWHNLLTKKGEMTHNYSSFTVSGERIYMVHMVYGEEFVKQSISYFDINDPNDIREFVPEIVPKEGMQSNIDCLLTDKDGNLFVVYTRMPSPDPVDSKSESFDWETYLEEAEKKQEIFLNKYSPEGEVLYEKNLTEALYSMTGIHFTDGVVDETGNLFLVNDRCSIIRVDEEGNVAVFEKLADSLPPACFDARFGKTEEGLIFLRDLDALYEMNPETGEYAQILKWLDYDINGNYIQNFLPLSTGNILVHYWSWESAEQSLIILEKTLKSQVAEKKILTIGCFYPSASLKKEVELFNKENTAYRIEIRDYAASVDWSKASANEDYNNARNRFQMDLLSDNAPDMFMDMYIGGMIENLVEKGAVEDLAPYLETSKELSKEDFFASILDANTYDGVLYMLPRTFIMQTCFCRTEDMGEKSGWTMQDLKALCNKYPEASVFPNASRDEIFRLFTANSMDSFLNMETGECFFEGQDFKDFLEICKSYPKEFDGEYEEASKALREHTALLYLTDILDMESYIRAKEIFGCPASNIGYPGNGSNSGARVFCAGISISSSSKYKDVCFGFIEKTMEDNSIMHSGIEYGFPAKISVYDTKMAEIGVDGFGTTDIGIDDARMAEYCDELREMIEGIDDHSVADQQIWVILEEEVQAYFEDQKSLDEVTKNVQSRVKLYLSEKQ